MNTGSFQTCETKHGLMDIYIAGPDTKKKAPVLIVLQEAFGVNAHIRSICERFANAGYLTAAPELFHRQGRRVEIPYGDRNLIMPYLSKLNNNEIIQDVRDTINFLADLPTADTSNVNTIGFCMGGFSSALVATKLNIKNMISFYGAGMVRPREGIGLSPIIQDMGSIKSRCLFIFGGKDASIPSSDMMEIEQKLTSSKVKFEVVIYEYSDHGFFCDERSVYNAEDARNAWEKSLAFLQA